MKYKSASAKPIAFVWDNFGPVHVDRCDAVATRFEGRRSIVGIEIGTRSSTYLWDNESGETFKKVTIFPGQAAEDHGLFSRFWGTLRACLQSGAQDLFFCHYDHPATLLTAFSLKLLGRNVYAMGCSKFDDYARSLRREVLKSAFYLPYRGGLSSGIRARDYMRFLGLKAKNVTAEYNTVSLARIRRLAAAPPAPDGISFSTRHFTIVARLVPKKNIALAMEAFALFNAQSEIRRELHLYGSGPLEEELRLLSVRLGIDEQVRFHGFVQTDGISKGLTKSLALLLPSFEEQFGNVVIEALAMGVPVILSDNCGARDLLVRTGVNGFIFEPDNAEGLALFMKMVGHDEKLWRRLCAGALERAEQGDAARFADGVEALIDRRQ